MILQKVVLNSWQADMQVLKLLEKMFRSSCIQIFKKFVDSVYSLCLFGSLVWFTSLFGSRGGKPFSTIRTET